MILPVPDTIVALATPPGRGGVGIVRVSGNKAGEIGRKILGKLPKPRAATLASFYSVDGNVLDQGIVVYFENHSSFTGEEVLELQGHGSPVVLDELIQNIILLGARMARPGEFSERAFLNGKLDLTQAEAIADLIDGATRQATHSAMRSLQGAFGSVVENVCERIVTLRVMVEATIDFSDEDFAVDEPEKFALSLLDIIHSIKEVQKKATQGVLLQEGMHVVLAGTPNVGKSSLLNCLSGRQTAIITDIPGTTRDVLHERIQVDGITIQLSDTAGIRESEDVIEREGVSRAHHQMSQADRVLWVVDNGNQDIPLGLKDKNMTLVVNKIDLMNEKARLEEENGIPCVYLSAKTGEGVDLLLSHLKQCVGYGDNAEGIFSARRRHLTALNIAEGFLRDALQKAKHANEMELLAEDLRQAQKGLEEITGKFYNEDLLTRIFSEFCIGK